MRFRPCIDIHDGCVKQIVGSSLDKASPVRENFVSSRDGIYFAEVYDSYDLTGGHIIILNRKDTPEYEASMNLALRVLERYPGKWQIGGGISPENADFFLEHGASHVIVTSYVFHGGELDRDRLARLVDCTGRDRLVLDLSCRRVDDSYLIATDRWVNTTDTRVDSDTLDDLMESCSEFLVHAVDVEGSSGGIDRELVQILGRWGRIPVTYAGGVHDMADIRTLYQCGKGCLDVTIGSGLDLFGGPMSLKGIVEELKRL